MEKDNTRQEMTLEQIFARLDEITSSLEEAGPMVQIIFVRFIIVSSFSPFLSHYTVREGKTQPENC